MSRGINKSDGGKIFVARSSTCCAEMEKQRLWAVEKADLNIVVLSKSGRVSVIFIAQKTVIALVMDELWKKVEVVGNL